MVHHIYTFQFFFPVNISVLKIMSETYNSAISLDQEINPNSDPEYNYISNLFAFYVSRTCSNYTITLNYNVMRRPTFEALEVTVQYGYQA